MQTIKLKSLLPSLREKKRYIVYEIISRNKLEYVKVRDVIVRSILQFLGEFDYGNAGVIIIDDVWDYNLQRGVIKVSHNYVAHIKSSLMLITEINNEEVIIQIIGVSGILKKVKKRFFMYERGDFQDATNATSINGI